jgi:hypothetical protein
MYRLNLRDGDSPFRFGPPTWLNITNEVLSMDHAKRLMDGADIGLLIHGYNVDEALPAYALVAQSLGDAYPVICGATWPGSTVRVGYWFAEHRADAAGERLAHIFADLPYRSLDVQGHSCGCRVALEAVRCGLRVRNLVLAAAAVDNESVQVDKRYGPYLQTNCENVLVAYSKNDSVLRKAFRISSWLKRAARLRFWGDDCKALGYTGPQNPEKCPFNLQAVELPSITRHGNYKDNSDYFAAWLRLVKR